MTTNPLLRGAASALLFVGVLGGGATEAAEQEPVVAGPFRFSFATKDQAEEVLGTTDRFVKAMSPFDRQVRLKAESDPGEAKYLTFAADQYKPWPEADRKAVIASIEELAEPLRKFRKDLAMEVLLIHTTGKDESEAAYTRKNAIILPVGTFGKNVQPDARLIAHELFHILSRHDDELRDRLYATIGFRRVGPIELPKSLRDLKMTNPDAPVFEHVIDVKLNEDRKVTVTPVLFARGAFDNSGGSLFGYMRFQLMEVVPMVGKRYIPVIDDEKSPVMHNPSLPDFHRQIGGNTGYIIHPEEILADNFSFYVTGSEVKDRWVTEAVAKEFEQADSE